MLGMAAQTADDPPANLAKLVAHRETETQMERDEYMYRQTVTIQELDDRGSARGEYKEVRDVIFSPAHERTEQMVGKPQNGRADPSRQDIKGDKLADRKRPIDHQLGAVIEHACNH